MPHITDFKLGYEFAPIRFQLRPQEVDLYLQAVEESGTLLQQQALVPPTALIAYALRGILLEIGLPPGAIHTAQEASFSRSVASGESILFTARLSRNAVRSGWRFVSIVFSGVDENGTQVVHGRSTVVISEDQIEGMER